MNLKKSYYQILKKKKAYEERKMEFEIASTLIKARLASDSGGCC
ncbi:hypothetical protein RMAECT_1383 [Rickettsia rhipicephali str. Ect]|uniref:Uncharacterized protein n=1 Tax=Rickettsia rhipicephali str. Ect TaxID=1359199 RepID=A0A0F3PGV3_RICRH|nr:hypothetical protein RMAECT_1383 [Rickettsia rhipicephali str. Ect]